jgi:hypothetical protein
MDSAPKLLLRWLETYAFVSSSWPDLPGHDDEHAIPVTVKRAR